MYKNAESKRAAKNNHRILEFLLALIAALKNPSVGINGKLKYYLRKSKVMTSATKAL